MHSKKIGYILLIYLFVLGTTFSPFYFDGINYLFIGVTVFSIVLYFFLEIDNLAFVLDKDLLLLTVFLLAIFFFTNNLSRISSFYYSAYFIFSYLLLAPFLRKNVTKKLFLKCIRILISSYFIMIVVQQICFLSGIQIINMPKRLLASDIVMESITVFRLNSLSSEPSYGATIIIFLGYIFFLLNGFKKKDVISIWLPCLYTWFFFDSTLSLVLLGILFTFISVKRFWIYPILCIAVFVFLQFSGDSLNRVYKIFTEVSIFDFKESFSSIDLSGALRLLSTINFIQSIDIFSGAFYFGHGPDFAGWTIALSTPGISKEVPFLGGLISFMLIDFGIIPFILFVRFIHKNASFGNPVIFYLFFFFVSVNANFNTQLVWFFITFSNLTKHILKLERST